jgi:acyl dehydratase/NAD(P)-dependent dehydrogenase (short-subunit alcohol dehydrogenase family)
MAEKIGHRIFTAGDLIWFAEASGDWNPIHVDPVKARRTLAGELVVHGIFSLLWALECHFSIKGNVPSTISAYFQRPILPGEVLDVYREVSGEDVRLGISRKSEEVASVVLSGMGTHMEQRMGASRPAKCEPVVKTFEELRGSTGSIEITALASDVASEFAYVSQAMGAVRVAGIMALSRIVGMQCPGLHSLFTGLEATLAMAGCEQMGWQIARQSFPYAPLIISADGAGLKATLSAFVRPEPVAQVSISEVAKTIDPHAFAGQKALVVGGSRGLGELVAKLVAAGGGEVVITYHRGAEDAQRVVKEIVAWGGKCRDVNVDVERPSLVAEALHGWVPTQLYYFATPKIRSQKSGTFDDDLYALFYRIYVTAFEELVRMFAKYQRESLSVFYPSTVFVDQPPKDFAEYVAAKKAGEALCESLNQEIPYLHVVVHRLATLKTDQTASLLPRSLKSSLPEIERIVRQMQTLPKKV